MTGKERSIESTHPSAEALAGFACNPQAARYAKIAAHVAECAPCRREAEHATGVVAGLRQLGAVSTASLSSPHLTANDLDAYLSGQDPTPRLAWQQHIDVCGDCRRAVLLRRTRLAAQSNLKSDTGTAPVQHASPSDVTRYIGFQRRVPLWSAVPLAMAAGLLAALAPPLLLDGTRAPVVIASYQDDARIVFMPSTDQPELGFFDDAVQQAEPYPGLSLRVAGSMLELSWPAVPDATGYDVHIVSHEVGSDRVIFEAHTEAVVLSAALALLEPGRRYSWKLTGLRQDGMRFIARGGFVMKAAE